MRILSMMSVALCVGTAAASAQDPPTTQIVTPRYALVPRNPPSLTEVHGRFTGSLDTVGWWVNYFIERRAQGDAERALTAQFAALEPNLKWAPAGYGALLKIEVIGRSDPDSVFSLKAILGDSAQFVGYGAKPEAALFASLRGGAAGPSIPAGWSEIPSMSCYVWVSRDSHGHLTNAVVQQGTVVDLFDRVRNDWPSMWNEELQRNLNNQLLWKSVADTAKQRLQDRQAKAAVDEALKAVSDSQKRVAESNARLQTALEDAKSAAGALTVLRTLQGTLSVAKLAETAADWLKESPTTFNGANSGSAVMQRVEQIKDGREQVSMQLNVQFEGNRDELQRFLNQLWDKVKPANPPTGLVKEFDVKMPRYVPIP